MCLCLSNEANGKIWLIYVLGYGLPRCLEVMGPPHRRAKIPIYQRAETCHRKTRLAAEVHQLFDIPLSSGYGLLRCLEVMGPPHRKPKIPIHQRAETCHRKTRLAAEVHQFVDIPLSSDMVYCVAWKLWDHPTGKLRFQFTRELKPATERQG